MKSRLFIALLLATLPVAFAKPAHNAGPHPLPPAADGLRFERYGAKTPDTLAHPAGGPKERIEVQSTEDTIDYVTKSYVLHQANAAEVYLFIANSIVKEGGTIDRYAPGSTPTVTDGKLNLNYSGESLIVVTVPEWMVSYLDETIKQLDRADFRVGNYGNASIYIHPRHRRPSEIVEHLTAVAASGRQSYHADDSRNVIYLEDVPSYFEFALTGLREYDVPPDQLDLSIRIFEIDEQDGKDVGVDWYAFKKSASGGGFSWKWGNAGNGGSYNGELESFTGELSFNPNLATEFLNFIADKGRAKVITDSQLTLINGKLGTLNAVTQIPYVIRGWIGGKVADQPNLDSPTATNPDGTVKEFTEGVTLSILPTLGTDSIQLDVDASVSSHVGYTPNQNVPIISTSDVSSVIVLESGKAALLGGLKRKRNVFERQGIPGLKDLGGIKYLFSHEVSRERESQIIVTLLPTRVNPRVSATPAKKEALPLESKLDGKTAGEQLAQPAGPGSATVPPPAIEAQAPAKP